MRLVGRLRAMIGDIEIPQTFTDAELSTALAFRGHDARYLALEPLPTVENGRTVYYEFVAPYRWWADTTQVVDLAYQPLTPAEVDLDRGYIRFASPVNPPVYIVGRYFDLELAAADLLDEWAARIAAGSYDVSADGTSLALSQRAEAMRAAARELRRRAGAMPVRATREV